MPLKEPQVDAVGLVFRAIIYDGDDGTTIVDLSPYTTKNFIVKKPNGTGFTRAASFYTDGTDGMVQFTTIDGDLSIGGMYKYQVYFEDDDENHFYTDVVQFKVHINL